ncbi:MAG: bifunctional ADP-heptose synthase [Gemmatimonadetes bacterium]|nr:bifunctional ADP-heptose synthase [Gemmatimonadota bacterium]
MPSELISRDRLAALLNAASGKHIVVIGDAMLDVYLRGEVDRVSPEAPVPVVRVTDRRMALGGAANVAQNVVALGARPTLVSAVGRDEAATELRAALRAIGATSDGLVEVDRPTTRKTRVVARAQQLLRFDEEVDHEIVGAEVKRLAKAAVAAIATADALILEDYNKGVLAPLVIERAIDAAHKRGIPIVVDPKYRSFFAFGRATVFKPNRRELESALGPSANVDDDAALLAQVDGLEVDALLLTLGERGMAIAVRGEQVTHRIPTTAREVYDVVGAGDTVTAYLAAILAAGDWTQTGTLAVRTAALLEAAVIANFAAGVEVGKSGAATVAPAEVIAAFDRHTEKR